MPLCRIKGSVTGGTARRTELVELMNLAGPFGLNADGKNVFTFPYTTIEDVLVLDSHMLLVVYDNNFPYGGGRELASDNTEFLKIRLPFRLTDEDEDDGHGHGHGGRDRADDWEDRWGQG